MTWLNNERERDKKYSTIFKSNISVIFKSRQKHYEEKNETNGDVPKFFSKLYCWILYQKW